MTPQEATEAAGRAAEAIRALNHQSRPGVVELDVTDVYTVLGELALMASRLPQMLRQVEALVDQLVEDDHVLILTAITVVTRPSPGLHHPDWLASNLAASNLVNMEGGVA